jgi:ribose transport system substrate-binding protein
MVPKGVHPYYKPCEEGFMDAAEKYGVDAKYQPPTELKLPLQVKVLEGLIARQVNGITVSALDDEGLAPVIDEAVEAGIKVITFDASAPSSEALCYIGTSNEKAGYKAGEEMIKLIGGKGKIAVLQGGLGASNLNQRFKGFKKALEEKAPEIKIVAREDTEGKMSKVVDKTEALLEAHPDIKAIFGVSALCAPGAASVIEEQKKTGKIIVAGFDDLPDTLDAIKKGVVSFCLAQKTYKMGWLSVEMLLKAQKGEKLPKEIDTGVVIVTKDNIDTYMTDMKKEFKK